MIAFFDFLLSTICALGLIALSLVIVPLIIALPWIVKSFLDEHTAKFGQYELNMFRTKLHETVFFGIIAIFILSPLFPLLFVIALVPIILFIVSMLIGMIFLAPTFIREHTTIIDRFNLDDLKSNSFEIAFFTVVIGLIVFVF